MYQIGEEEIEAVRRVIESKNLFRYQGGAGETEQFEQEWAAKIGTKYTLAVTSGTAALICGLAGLGLGPGDEVLVPAYTFISTALAPLAVGAVPILVEVDESLTMAPEDLERKITPRTRAIIPVHMNGLPCNMEAIMEIARQHKLTVLEDACQADGGSYRGQRLGSIGDAGAFSFNYFKILTCGEGGALATNNQAVYERAVYQQDGGAAFFQDMSDVKTPGFAGWNFRMNEILGAILRVQVTRLEGILAALRAEKKLLREALADASEFGLSRVNDLEGDCATTLSLLFESAERVKEVLERLSAAGVGAMTPINSGRHVYVNWEPILHQRGAHHPGRDAYRSTRVPVSYARDMCPQTLSVLARTINIATSIDRSPEAQQELITQIKQAVAAR
ncbi:MAG TPA: DegT/DnrJ/EryC1/StrS family aminotransferase [Abditibacteriaceae bacterium]|nr:DegT/DnrJ/EryC1/StrS family aminotransferase [Abditibacteriaceae bacterium]